MFHILHALLKQWGGFEDIPSLTTSKWKKNFNELVSLPAVNTRNIIFVWVVFLILRISIYITLCEFVRDVWLFYKRGFIWLWGVRVHLLRATQPRISSALVAVTLLFSLIPNLSGENSVISYFLLSATLTLITSVALLTDKNKKQLNLSLAVFSTFFFLVYLYVTTSNIITFIAVYEAFLLPSAYLVYQASPNKRSLRSTFYFLVWTQAGSLLVVCGLTGVAWVNQTTSFEALTHCPTALALLIFIGFGIKIPIFPFFFWLTKTHVEAISSFSVYLSGFLVKLALFGLIKVSIIFSDPTVFTVTTISAITSIVVATIGFYYQTDYKKIIAYATIQEMNILLLLTVLLYTADFRPTAALLAVHTALSAIFFSLADMIYKRYKTRALKNIKALLVASPVLYTLMLISLIIFKGIPFSSKFAIEFSLYAAAYNLSVYTFTLLLTILVFIGNTIISIQHFKIAFGSSPQTVSDLQAKEILTLLIPICTLTLVVV